MSYDLLFDAASGKKIDKRSFAAYFNGRRHFEVGNGQAHYQHEDTGVYFIFDEPADGVVAFNLNFYRPHVFGLEAAIELQAFADAFKLDVTDPQGERAAPAKFDRDTFLRNWNHGNRFAYQSMAQEQSDGPVHTWPAKRIREVWDWNYTRPTEEQSSDDDPFVPSIFVADVKGQPWSIAICPPECSILIPEVDALLVPLAQTGKASEEMALVPWPRRSRSSSPIKSKPRASRATGGISPTPGRRTSPPSSRKKRKPVGRMNGSPCTKSSTASWSRRPRSDYPHSPYLRNGASRRLSLGGWGEGGAASQVGQASL